MDLSLIVLSEEVAGGCCDRVLVCFFVSDFVPLMMDIV